MDVDRLTDAPRLRTLRLVRRINFGFSLRGGREHGTGFFVSAVEASSEAARQGLRVGDQIIRVNGYSVEDAIHGEMLQLLRAQNRLVLRVRSVGMIPVKDKHCDPLTWRLVDEEEERTLETGEVRLMLTVAPRSKLGCGICKGPSWKSGIFVQFVKEKGLAREAGLRPGDQIIECNGISFTDISFSDAVHIMKASQRLDLLVRKGAGLDLFPGESSGYNSSESSVNGDGSPGWEDGKRLSVVREEEEKSRQWEQIEYEWGCADDRPVGSCCTVIRVEQNNNDSSAPDGKESPKNGRKLAEIRLVSQQQETRTVVVEVHRTDEEEDERDRSLGDQSTPSIELPVPPAEPGLMKSESSSSLGSSASSSLSSAIALELQRRWQRRESDSQEDSKRSVPVKSVDDEKHQQHEQLMEEFRRAHRKMFAHAMEAEAKTNRLETELATLDIEQRKPFQSKHQQTEENQLQMTKKQQSLVAVKQRVLCMNQDHQDAAEAEQQVTQLLKKRPAPPPPPMPSEQNDCSSRPSSLKNSPSTLSLASSNNSSLSAPSCPTPDYDTVSITSSSPSLSVPFTAGSIHGSVLTSTKITDAKSALKPVTNEILLTTNSSKPAVCASAKVSVNKSDTKSATNVKNVNQSSTDKIGESVEMQSLESFKLTNPTPPDPKPPPTYFVPQKVSKEQNNVNASTGVPIRKDGPGFNKPRPISVTIGEYPSGVERRVPERLRFLPPPSASGKIQINNGPISCKLQSELAQTLSRSNLLQKTESQENVSNGGSTSGKGTVTVSVNSQLENGEKISTWYLSSSVAHTKPFVNGDAGSRDHKNVKAAAEKLANVLAGNRVTIKVSNGNSDLKTVNEATNRSPQPNGILKNGNCLPSQNVPEHHKTVVQQKSITFGKITTVISDIPT